MKLLKDLYPTEDTLGIEPVAREDAATDTGISTHYTYCNGCEQFFKNEDVMVVEEVGEFCFKCLYNIVRLYFQK